jgi:hypothetical protein
VPHRSGVTLAPPRPDLDAPPPTPGSLGIKERRSWRTWQLGVGLVAALLVGMLIGHSGSGGTVSGSSSGKHGYTLPPASGATTVPTTTAPTTSAGSATADSSTTTVPGAAQGPAIVLVPAHEARGNWTSPQFTVSGGTWNIGWAYQCTPPPSAGPAFQVFAVAPGQAPGTPSVNETAGSGQSVAPMTSSGPFQIVVQAPANCLWIVKVTGVGTPAA